MSGKGASKDKSAKQTEVIAAKAASPTPLRQPNGPAEVLGDVVWLMTQSPNHKHQFIADLEWLVMPPVMLRQFRLVRGQDKPQAFITWAMLNEEAESRLMAGHTRLRPSDWNSGDRAWIVDLVAPFGGQEAVLTENDHQGGPADQGPKGKGRPEKKPSSWFKLDRWQITFLVVVALVSYQVWDTQFNPYRHASQATHKKAGPESFPIRITVELEYQGKPVVLTRVNRCVAYYQIVGCRDHSARQTILLYVAHNENLLTRHKLQNEDEVEPC